MSTPSVLLGKSFTCPSEASTEKPLPKYFWMVFALAGDSTMTKPLDNVSSTSLLSVFEASTNGREATSNGKTSCWLSAVSSQLLQQRAEHSFNLDNLVRKTLAICRLEKLKIFRQE